MPKCVLDGVINGVGYRGITPVLRFGANLARQADDRKLGTSWVFLPDEVFDFIAVELLPVAPLLPFPSPLSF